MKKHFILVLMILVIIGQFPRELNCQILRKFSLLFKKSRKETELEKGVEKSMKELQNKLALQVDETRREIIRKYLLPQAGRTSFMSDFIDRF
jgi:hypothetical protein